MNFSSRYQLVNDLKNMVLTKNQKICTFIVCLIVALLIGHFIGSFSRQTIVEQSVINNKYENYYETLIQDSTPNANVSRDYLIKQADSNRISLNAIYKKPQARLGVFV